MSNHPIQIICLGCGDETVRVFRKLNHRRIKCNVCGEKRMVDLKAELKKTYKNKIKDIDVRIRDN